MQRRYKIGAELPEYDAPCVLADGWAALPDADIPATDGDTVVVVDCTMRGALARKGGSCTAAVFTRRAQDLVIIGNSLQDGTPSLSAPVPVTSCSGNLVLEARGTDGNAIQTVSVPLRNADGEALELRRVNNSVDVIEYRDEQWCVVPWIESRTYTPDKIRTTVPNVSAWEQGCWVLGDTVIFGVAWVNASNLPRSGTGLSNMSAITTKSSRQGQWQAKCPLSSLGLDATAAESDLRDAWASAMDGDMVVLWEANSPFDPIPLCSDAQKALNQLLKMPDIASLACISTPAATSAILQRTEGNIAPTSINAWEKGDVRAGSGALSGSETGVRFRGYLDLTGAANVHIYKAVSGALTSYPVRVRMVFFDASGAYVAGDKEANAAYESVDTVWPVPDGATKCKVVLHTGTGAKPIQTVLNNWYDLIFRIYPESAADSAAFFANLNEIETYTLQQAAKAQKQIEGE